MPRILYDRMTKPKRRRKKIGAGLKLLLLLAVIFGFYMRSCWFDSKQNKITFHNISVKLLEASAAELNFKVVNNSAHKGSQGVLIQLYSDNNLIAQKIDQIYIDQYKTREYTKIIESFLQPVKSGSKIDSVNIEIYKPSIFK